MANQAPLIPEAQLYWLTGQPIPACRAALKKCKGDVVAAYKYLAPEAPIDAPGGRITAQMLDDMVEKAKALRQQQLFRDIQAKASLPKPKPKPKAFPPFPILTPSMNDLVGEDKFPSWTGYMDVRTSPKARPNATGRVELKISSPEDATSIAAPLAEQAAAYQYLKDHEQQITRAILKAALPYYLKVRTWDAKADDPKRNTPKITSVEGLKSLMGPYQIDFRPIAKSGLSYVGFSFDCTWDEEHGTGVLTHKSRVIEIGESDTSFDDESAENDGGKQLRTP